VLTRLSLLRRKQTRRGYPRDRLPALVVGAGAAGRSLARSLRDPTADLIPVGFLDDNDILCRVHGLPVLGGTDKIHEVAGRTGAEMVLLAIPSLPPSRVADLVERAWAAGLAVRSLPPGGTSFRDLWEMRLSRLIGRDEVAVPSSRARRVVQGRRVLVTGAGGMIGSALSHQLTRLNPASLTMIDQDALELRRLRLEIDGSGCLAMDRIATVRADVRDGDEIAKIFEDAQPELVFHAAQHQRLPELERDPCEGVRTNVRGTQHVVDAAVRFRVRRLALVSTDKAADPTSVFGATKRLSELVLQTHAGGPTCFAAVRFGNVIGSPGSLLSALAGRIARNEAITITHPDVARHFMTVEEAAGLVLEATALAEEAETFVLDMGNPVPVVDLVHRYAEQLHVPEVTIRFSGLGSGEKLAEKVFSDTERRVPTAHPKVWATGPCPVPAGLPRLLGSLYAAADVGDEDATRTLLRRLLPEYRPLRRPEALAAGAAETHSL
jgi:FlaA1/EpsC-like NDP-sugar epimerase